ncbi:MAG: hypothetical protein ACFFCW_09340 [Candidatus Hodarchaeota archaeon]
MKAVKALAMKALDEFKKGIDEVRLAPNGLADMPQVSLTEEEIERVIYSCLQTGPPSREGLTNVIEWAVSARHDNDILQAVLDGKILVGWDPASKGPVFQGIQKDE